MNARDDFSGLPVYEVFLGDDYVLFVRRAGQYIEGWEYSEDCKLSDSERTSDIEGGELKIPLAVAKARNYAYYNYSPRSRCNCGSLRNVTNRTCRGCEYKKRSTPEYLRARKEKERGTPELRLKNNEQNSKLQRNRNFNWRNNKNVSGEKLGRKKTNKANKEWARRHPEIIKKNRDRYDRDKFLATPPWVNKEEMLVIMKEVTDKNANGAEFDVDHSVALRAGYGSAGQTFQIICGLNVEYNLQVLEKKENITKSNSIPLEFKCEHTEMDLEYLREKAMKVGLTENGYLPEDELDRLYEEKKRKHPTLLL